MCTAESSTFVIVIPTETPTCINTKKKSCHLIFTAETVTCISAAETSNYIISTETVTCRTATERSSNITTTKTTICIVAIESQNLNNFFRRYHLPNFCREYQLHSSNRNFHLNIWLYTETFTCRNNVSQRFFMIKKLAEWVRTRFKAK